MVRVKICGITRLEDALEAARGGADAVGFVFHRPSPRYILPEIAAEIIFQLPPLILRVGVFVDESPEEVRRIFDTCGLDAVQLHGSEPPETMKDYPGRVIKGVRVKGPERNPPRLK